MPASAGWRRWLCERAVAADVLLPAGGAAADGQPVRHQSREMDTVVSLSGDRLVATHYGLYNTVSGLGITLGNLATGALWDFAGRHHALWHGRGRRCWSTRCGQA
jgi:hypothetical protein